LFRRISQTSRPPGGIASTPAVRSPTSDWLRLRASHRRLTTLTFHMITTYVAGRLASFVALSQRRASGGPQGAHPGLIIDQPNCQRAPEERIAPCKYCTHFPGLRARRENSRRAEPLQPDLAVNRRPLASPMARRRTLRWQRPDLHGLRARPTRRISLRLLAWCKPHC